MVRAGAQPGCDECAAGDPREHWQHAGAFMQPPGAPSDTPMVIGLDPGNAFGYAVLDRSGGLAVSGRWQFAPRKGDHAGDRWGRCLDKLRALFVTTSIVNPHDHASRYPVLVAYEHSFNRQSVSSAAVFHGYLAMVQLAAVDVEAELRAVPWATVKKVATGNGRADKAAVIEAARSHYHLGPLTEDEADAIWVARAARDALEVARP